MTKSATLVDLLVCGLVFDTICHIISSSGNNFFTLVWDALALKVCYWYNTVGELGPKSSNEIRWHEFKFANNKGDK
jgi:hypothetical protein